MREATKSIKPEIALANGVVLCADVWASERSMWIWMRDEADPYNSIKLLSELLTTPGATDTITKIQPGAQVEYVGYTKMTSVKYYQGNLVGARLEKGASDV